MDAPTLTASAMFLSAGKSAEGISDAMKELDEKIAQNKGDSAAHDKLIAEIQAAPYSAGATQVLTTVKGGETKLVAYWWGTQLYIDHQTLQDATSVGELANTLVGLLGPEVWPIVAAVAITLFALKIMDRGNGIIISQPWIGPPIPTPQ
jgi:hypothetical protein